MSSSQPTPDAGTPAGIPWQPWSAEAFARAAREQKPVLLSITASWCHGCAVMDRTTYSAPALVDAIVASTVPVRVDADRRPDINDRYNLDGWPTTAFLTADGEVLTGSTYVTPDQMARMLADVTEGMRTRFDDLLAGAARMAGQRVAARRFAREEPDMDAPAWVAARIVAEWDREHGGFGADGKFLNLAPLRFALAWWRTAGDERLRDVVRHTLDAMTTSLIVDEVDGGVFRYAASRDWLRPHTEKMLEDQVALVSLLLDAAVALGRPVWRDRAQEIMRYVQRTLSDPVHGGFFASQRADEDFYAASASIRDTFEPPVVDRTLFTDRNAQAAGTWIEASQILGQRPLAEFAARSLERVLIHVYRPGEGVSHYVGDDAPRGLLTDQVYAAAALLDLHEATGDETHAMLAEELMRTIVRTNAGPAGGFLDHRPGGDDDIGLMRDPVLPLGLNSLAARVLARLVRVTGKVEFQQTALDTLRSQTPGYRSHGIGAAPYALAIMEVFGGGDM
jgi:uncharacterized protein